MEGLMLGVAAMIAFAVAALGGRMLARNYNNAREVGGVIVVAASVLGPVVLGSALSLSAEPMTLATCGVASALGLLAGYSRDRGSHSGA